MGRVALRGKLCAKCEKPAEAKYKGNYLCGDHLNPPPTQEYLWLERLRVLGQSCMSTLADHNPGPPSFTSKERRSIGL